ncbi:hypothetical protein JD844_023980 [Phrynosoma platyrhinos]|uniref:DNA primase large subunit n=1 Tax=Phrynosoma platyrhinos TaxID=52577 RepID=A0ABQ7SXG4_PHRPL|nr:hypothetical protein JD844_023980 [Phrynosoma platyrhinos]
MQFSKGRWKGSRLVDVKEDQYPFSLQFYLQPPTENISLIEFESFAVDRLKLLKVVENLGVSYVKGTPQYKQRLESELKNLQFPYHALNEKDYDRRRKDHISHFILRLAYCQTEELRRWFIQQEMDLFRYRFTQLNEDVIKKFLAYVNLTYESVSEDEKKEIAGDLRSATPSFSDSDVKDNVFYLSNSIDCIYITFFIQVPFSDAADLVRVRRVYIHGGYAYVPHQDFLAILLNNYRTRLSKALAVSLFLPNLL